MGEAAEAEALLDVLLEDLVWDAALELHRGVRTGAVPPEEVFAPPPAAQTAGESELLAAATSLQRLQPAADPPLSFSCDHCGRSVNALRYAPHLDKCLGKGGRRAAAVARASIESPSYDSAAALSPSPQRSAGRKRGSTATGRRKKAKGAP